MIAGDRFTDTLTIFAGGLASAGVYSLTRIVWPEPVALLFALMILAFFGPAARRAQSGFARFCDGFGGGRSVERVLSIMNDANVGVFGVVGLSLAFLLQHAILGALAELSPGVQPDAVSAGLHRIFAAPREFLQLSPVAGALISSHSLSYAFAVLLARSLPPANRPAQSRDERGTEAVAVTLTGDAQKSRSGLRAFLAGAIGVFCLWIAGSPIFALASLALPPLFFWLRRVFRRRAGGMTIDLQGAAHQLARCLHLLAVAAVALR
ncbi:MAG: adenosylcobinamide-GDP ribazoletransferase [bacterium]|nr:adenosylcobinamide-GDP ribazoletransferase [bacterium]